jgi:hypothetical protein
LNTELATVADTKVQKALGPAEPDMNGKKIWVAITAHRPLARIDPLINVVRAYSDFPCDVSINIYVDYESQDCVEDLEKILIAVSNKTVDIKIASPEYENWYLTWAHKTDLALAVLNRQADFYIYQENDMVLTLENFLYWVRWKPRLSQLGLEPGFVRYENYEDKRIAFDNYFPYSLSRETPNIWGSAGFTVPKLLVVDRAIHFFVQLANPYYGAMILDQADGELYICSDSYDPQKSFEKVGIRNWPIADRSSMGLAFEDVPTGCEHRRCVPMYKHEGVYKLHPVGLIQHDDLKYSSKLKELHGSLLDCDYLLSLA